MEFEAGMSRVEAECEAFRDLCKIYGVEKMPQKLRDSYKVNFLKMMSQK